METTVDGILNHRLQIEQPRKGFRIAVDTVLLAAAVPRDGVTNLLDIGCGVGGSLLSAACRLPQISGTGLDVQAELVSLCQANIQRNHMAARLTALQANVALMPSTLQGKFDCVMMNPPYNDVARHDVSSNPIKAVADAETMGDLSQWIEAANFALAFDGVLTLIHRADRCDEILDLLQPTFGQVLTKSVLSKADTEPKRILIRAKLGGPFTVTPTQPFIMHQADGAYLPEAEAVLRHMSEIHFAPRPFSACAE